METTSIIRQLHSIARPPARCPKCSKQSAAKRSTGFGRDGFLKYQFRPLIGFYVRNWEQAEKEFFTSAVNLCNYYRLKVPNVSDLTFPNNIQTAYRQLSEDFHKDGLELKIMQDSKHDACLVTAKTFDTGYRLYYIPIKPVCRLAMSDETIPISKLLTSICQYLYQTVDVNYYREPSYLNFIYETIENWIDEDNEGEDEDYRKYQRDELAQMKTVGDNFLHILKQPFKVETLISLLTTYRENPAWDLEIDGIAQEFFKLATDHPNRSIKQSIPLNFYQTGESDLICLEHYLSFYWSGKDGFTEVIDDMVNNELQEMGYQEEPVGVQWFDQLPEAEHHDFDFEARLFTLTDTLIDLINQYDNEKHYQ